MAEGMFYLDIEGPGLIARGAVAEDVWTTRSGRQVRIAKMGDQHLVNTVKVLRREAPEQMYQACLQWDFRLENGPPVAEAEEWLVGFYQRADVEEFLRISVQQYSRLLQEVEKRGLFELLNTNYVVEKTIS